MKESMKEEIAELLYNKVIERKEDIEEYLYNKVIESKEDIEEYYTSSLNVPLSILDDMLELREYGNTSGIYSIEVEQVAYNLYRILMDELYKYEHVEAEELFDDIVVMSIRTVVENDSSL